MEEEDDIDEAHSPGPMIKDQQHLVKDLKKENFDLKLRLYMEQKNNESSGGQISEYENQISALLDKLEETSRFAEQIETEAKDLRMREKTLLTKYKRLENKCTTQEKDLSRMSQDLSKALSQSMQNVYITEVKHSTPIRAKSVYNVTIPVVQSNGDSGSEEEEEEEEEGIQPINISPVQPVRSSSYTARATESTPKIEVSSDRSPRQQGSSRILPNRHSTQIVTNTPVNNFYKYEFTDAPSGSKPRPKNEDNIGVVRPNNSRAVVDSGMNMYVASTPEEKKKKKKKFWGIFKMCGGKSSNLQRRNTSVYQKKDSPKARPIESRQDQYL